MCTMRFKKLIVGVAVLVAPAFALAQSAEQLIQKYTPLVGTAANAKALVTGLRNGTQVVMYMEVSAPPPPPPPPPLFGAPLPPPPVVAVTTQLIAVKCTPPEQVKMGFGNVDNALTLAQGSLENHKIVTGTPQPDQRAVTPADVCIALVGGTVTTRSGASISLPGVLVLRSQGLGWGEIANHPQVNVNL